MRRSILIIFLALACANNLSAQPDHDLRRFTLDLHFPAAHGYLNDWKAGAPSDAFLDFPAAMLGTKVRFSVYPTAHWGVYVDMSLWGADSKSFAWDEVSAAIADRYSDDYYLLSPYSEKSGGGGFQMSAGVQYRFAWGRWTLIPRIGFGVSHFTLGHTTFTLKGKGNNEQYFVSYRALIDYAIPEKHERTDRLTTSQFLPGYLNPGLQLGYRLRPFYLSLDVGYLQLFRGVTYSCEKTELYWDGRREEELYRSRRPGMWEVSIGLTLPFGRRL